MKRNEKYYKELPKKNSMNGLRHIVLLILGIGILIAQDPPEEFQFNSSTLQAFYYFNSVTIDGDIVDADDWVGAFSELAIVYTGVLNEEAEDAITDTLIAFELENMKVLENWDGDISKFGESTKMLEKLFGEIDKDKT